MRKPLLFCALVGTMTACQQETDIQPSSSTLADEAAGTYRTNVYLDPSRVNTPADQMPVTELKAESDSSVTLVYSKRYPAETTQSLKHIILSRQATAIQLRLAGSVIGTLEADRIFTNNGMEKQGKLLRFSVPDNGQNGLTFAGAR